MFDNQFFVQQGWQCPICKRVYSPFTSCCLSCGAEGMTKTSTDWIEHQKEPSSVCVSTEYTTYTADDKRTCDNCKYNSGLPMNTATKEYSMACKICYAKNMWKEAD